MSPCGRARIAEGGVFIPTSGVVQSIGILSLIRAVPDLLAAVKIPQCACSIAERDSGHLTECWYPTFEAVIAKVELQ